MKYEGTFVVKDLGVIKSRIVYDSLTGCEDEVVRTVLTLIYQHTVTNDRQKGGITY